MYAIDAKTRRGQLERAATAGPRHRAVANGLVYFGTAHFSDVEAHNAATGGTRVVTSPFTAPVDRHRLLSTGSSTSASGHVGHTSRTSFALNATTGATIWSADNGATGSYGFSISSSPAVANGIVYIGSDDGKVHAFNATTGAASDRHHRRGRELLPGGRQRHRLHRLRRPQRVRLQRDDRRHSSGPPPPAAAVNSSPAVANGIVYIGSDDHSVYAFNATTGAQLWTATTATAR